MKKRATSLRLSDQARSLLVRLSERLGISQTAVLEMAIRKLAREEGINDSGSH
jgi:predicted transcriptional regulator